MPLGVQPAADLRSMSWNNGASCGKGLRAIVLAIALMVLFVAAGHRFTPTEIDGPNDIVATVPIGASFALHFSALEALGRLKSELAVRQRGHRR